MLIFSQYSLNIHRSHYCHYLCVIKRFTQTLTMFHLKSNSKIIYPQWFAGIGVTLLVIQFGFLSGWTSPALARLTVPESPIPLSAEQASWVAALVNLGRFFGAIFGPVTASQVGSKQCIFVTTFPIAAGWILIGTANAVEMLYVARLLIGVGFGMAFSTFPLYIGEVSMPEIRGALISLAACGGPFGQVVAGICGSYLPMLTASAVYLAVCVLLMMMFLWLPESPHHLVKIGNHKAARESISWYRAGRGVDAELDAVEKFVASDADKSFAEKLREFKTPPVRRATFQIIALFFFMQICGLNSILFYMETIMIRANFTFFNPSLVVVYVSLCGIAASALSIFLIDKCGRRFLLLVSSSGVTLSMLGLMVYFLLMNAGVDTGNLQWLPPGAMFLYILSFCIGLMPVPSTILSEIFPANIKCIAASISGLTGATIAFISSKTYQPMVDLIGEAYVFMIYAIFSVIVIPYTIFIMPETKGKSLQQIQDELMKR